MMGKGNHEGCPYGVWMGWWSSNGFVGMGVWFPNHPYGKSGLDGEGCGGWIPASAGKTDVGVGGSRTTPPGRGAIRFDGEGQPQGLLLRGVDGVVVVEPVRQFGRAGFPNRPYGAK